MSLHSILNIIFNLTDKYATTFFLQSEYYSTDWSPASKTNEYSGTSFKKNLLILELDICRYPNEVYYFYMNWKVDLWRQYIITIFKWFCIFLFPRWPSCIDQDIQWWHKGKGRWSCQPTVFCSRWTSNYFQLGKRPEATGKFHENWKASPQFFTCCNCERPNKFWKIYLSYPGSISKHKSYHFGPKTRRYW